MSDHKPNKLHYFEVMDRTHCLLVNMQEVLYEHPGITPQILAQIEIAEAALAEAHHLSAKLFDEFKE